MKGYYLLILKRNFHLVLSVVTVVVCAAAVFESRASRLRLEKPLLIAIDTNGTRVISREDDPIFETEIVQFTRMFLSLLYNFTPETFTKSVGQASGYMSLKLWGEKESALLELSKLVKRQGTTLSGQVVSISTLTDGAYMARVKTKESTRMSVKPRELEVQFSLARVPRSAVNPWGIEVTRYEEKIAN